MAQTDLQKKIRAFSFSVPWNLALLTAGSFLIAFAVKAVIIPHEFLAGGMSGAGLLAYYVFGGMSPGMWYLALNVPVFLLGWVFVSRRFFLYSLYGMAVVSIFIDLIGYTVPIADKWLAVLAGGAILGAGVGVALRTLGSTGGIDIIMVLLNHRYNIRMGQTEFVFNAFVFLGGLAWLSLENILYSLALVAVMAYVMDFILGLFNARKMAIVVSEKPDEVARVIMDRIDKGVTFLPGSGGWTGKHRKVILTVVHNHQTKRLEELVYTIDPGAFTIMADTFNVLGEGFSRRKVY